MSENQKNGGEKRQNQNQGQNQNQRQGQPQGQQAQGQQSQNQGQNRNGNNRYNGGRNRNNHNKKGYYHKNNRPKVPVEETLEDITADMARIEKEIELEIKEITAMRLGM